MEFKSFPASINLLDKKLQELPGIKSIHRVVCSSKELIYPSKEYKPSILHRRFWCPYCGEERHFLQVFDGDFLCCEICRVSTKEYYVKAINHLESTSRKGFNDRKKAKRVIRREKRDKIKVLKSQVEIDEINKRREIFGMEE